MLPSTLHRSASGAPSPWGRKNRSARKGWTIFPPSTINYQQLFELGWTIWLMVDSRWLIEVSEDREHNMHPAENLKEKKKLVFTAQSAQNFHLRFQICEFVFEQGAIPLNPFMAYDYFLANLVEHDVIRNANNNLLARCDELWVFGDISDGVEVEIAYAKQLGKRIRFFTANRFSEEISEIKP